MVIVTKEITFDAGHRLLNYDGACHNVHGHTYRLQVSVTGRIDLKSGFVIDFKDLKAWMKSAVDHFDHAMIFNRDDHLYEPIMQAGLKTYIMDKEPTAENIAAEIKEMILSFLPKDKPIDVFKVKLWETPTSFVEV